MPKFTTVTGPAAWASYFVNGDASSLDDVEQAQADAWLARNGGSIVSTVDDSERFTWSFQVHAPETPYSGGDVIDYIMQEAEA